MTGVSGIYELTVRRLYSSLFLVKCHSTGSGCLLNTTDLDTEDPPSSFFCSMYTSVCKFNYATFHPRAHSIPIYSICVRRPLLKIRDSKRCRIIKRAEFLKVRYSTNFNFAPGTLKLPYNNFNFYPLLLKLYAATGYST